MRVISEYLALNPNLVVLELMNCEITPLGCEFLAKALCNIGTWGTLERPAQLSILKLDYNHIGDVGVKVLADSLRNDKLTMVSLAYCNITEVGCEALFEVLIY